MARRVSEVLREAQALEASRRMVARGERVSYRIRQAEDGSWAVNRWPWLGPITGSRSEALVAARAAVAAWLDVDESAIEVEVAEP